MKMKDYLSLAWGIICLGATLFVSYLTVTAANMWPRFNDEETLEEVDDLMNEDDEKTLSIAKDLRGTDDGRQR